MRGVKACVAMLAEAVNEVDFNRKYAIDDSPPGGTPNTKWYQNPLILGPVAGLIGALITAMATIGVAWINHPRADSQPKTFSIINGGDRELRSGQAADVFQNKDFIFVGIAGGRAHIIASGMNIQQLGDDFSFASNDFQDYTLKHDEKTYVVALKGPEQKGGESLLYVRVTESK
jgi:hypothetical protein